MKKAYAEMIAPSSEKPWKVCIVSSEISGKTDFYDSIERFKETYSSGYPKINKIWIENF